ncbi:MAG: response regulator [Deltaproteobacteria bacterium]|nr:response regulator [Deltaproteobacteria bacterium]
MEQQNYNKGSEVALIKLLIVDDEPNVAKYLGEMASNVGCDVERTTKPSEALSLVSAKTFDLIMLDLKMPEQDGISLGKKLKQFAPDAALVLVSGFADKYDLVHAIRAGFFDYLDKPVFPEQLESLISRWRRCSKTSLDEISKIQDLSEPGPFQQELEEFGRRLVESALRCTFGNGRKAAELLDVSYSTFNRLKKRYGIM